MRTILSASITSLLLLGTGVASAEDPKTASAQQPPTSIADFVKNDFFEDVKLSPTGEFVARSVNFTDTDGVTKRVLLVQKPDGTKLGHFNLAGKTEVEDFWWVSDKRLLITVGERFGLLERPQPTGEIYGMNADGTGQGILIGQRVVGDDGEASGGSHITTGKATAADAAFMVDGLRNDARHVIVSVVQHGTAGGEVFTKAVRMDVFSGQISVVASAPVRNAGFTTDLQGEVRFAYGAGNDNKLKTYYRDDAKSGWVLLNDEEKTHINVWPLGFAADGHTAYLRQESTGQSPDVIMAYDTVGHAMREVLRDPVASPANEQDRMVWDHPGTVHGPSGEVIGIRYLDAKPRVVFFDEKSDNARLYRSLEASFTDQAVVIPEYSGDGKQALVFTYSDRSPGDYYLFDIEHKQAKHLLSHRDWIDPDRMGEQRPFTLTSRDGRVLHGFLTLPAGSSGKNLPMVVNPHGGPFDVADEWGFDKETQLLASRGYAVLQVNFRGSAGFGREFVSSGYKQWGGAMQDDVTDATKWAIQQGIADPNRICIYGASYGGYAALMGVAKEPSLYRCAIGYVGVYDLPIMYNTGDIQKRKSGTNFLKDTLGEQNLEALSPARLADRIKVPVLLAAGKEDERAPPKHTELMRDALQKAGKSVDATIYAGEGHGFYKEQDRESFYNSMLIFLDRNIGPNATR